MPTTKFGICFCQLVYIGIVVETFIKAKLFSTKVMNLFPKQSLNSSHIDF